jgi:hypothetical protein
MRGKCGSLRYLSITTQPSIHQRMVLYDFTLSGLLTQVCLCAVKPSCSGVGITGIMPIETVTWPGIASSFEMMGLEMVSTSFLNSRRFWVTYFPSTAQNHRCIGFPLSVALSSKSFSVPSLSFTSTFSSSMVRFVAAIDPDAFRQFSQWQR